jgi:hypothetical protein
MSIEDGTLSFDIRSKPVGYFWGGKRRTSVACPVCSKPALRLPKQIKREGVLITQYAHAVRYSLDAKNEATPDYGAPCEHKES